VHPQQEVTRRKRREHSLRIGPEDIRTFRTLTSKLPKFLPGTREKTDLVRAYFADLIASVLKGKR
jgi:hypothetical protein